MAGSDETARDLLFGLLALQEGLIDENQLVDEHCNQHGDAGKSVAVFDIGPSIREKLKSLSDDDLTRSLLLTTKSEAGDPYLTVAPDPFATRDEPHDPYQTVSPSGLGSESGDYYPGDESSFGITSGALRFRVLRPHAQGGSARSPWLLMANSTAKSR